MRLLRNVLAFLLVSLPAVAQFTTVTGTVTDPNGVPYSNGTIAPVLVNNSGQSVTLNGFAYTPPTQATGLDTSGKFVLNLPANGNLSPGGTTWNFWVCSAVGTVNPSIGTGSQCFTLSSPLTIAGASQDISTQLQAAALALTKGGAATSVPWSGVTAGSNTKALTIGTGGSMAPLNLGQVIGSQYVIAPGVLIPTSTGANSGGSIIAAHGWVIQYTFQTVAGESLPSVQLSGNTTALSGGTCVSANCTLTINAPTFPTGVTGWNVYACDTSAGGPCTLPQLRPACQNLAAGVNCTFTTVQTSNTTGVPTLNTAWTQPTNVQAQSPTIPIPQGWVPSLFATKNDGNNYPVLGLDSSNCSPLISPCGVPMWVDRLFINDTGVNLLNACASSACFGNIKNNPVSIAHTVGNGTTATNGNDDRAVGWRVTTPTTMTGSANPRVMGFYGEMYLNGTPTALTGGGPDSGLIGMRNTLVDQRSGGSLSNSPLVGFDAFIQGLQTGGASYGSCNPCAAGFRATVSPTNGGSLSFAAFSGTVSGSGVFGETFNAVYGGATAGNVALYANNGWASGAQNYLIRSDASGLASIIGGTLYVPSLQADASTLAVAGSVGVTGAITTSQLSGSSASPGCTPGATNYVMKLVPRDATGQASGAQTINFNNCSADVNAGTPLSISNINQVGASTYDVYLGSAAGTCNGIACTLGKVTTLTPSYTAAQRSPVMGFTYTGTAGDTTTAPTINTTGVHLSAMGFQSTAKTFANIPTCASGTEGMTQAISDSTVNTFGTAIAGGGANHVLGYCDGTSWKVGAI